MARHLTHNRQSNVYYKKELLSFNYYYNDPNNNNNLDLHNKLKQEDGEMGYDDRASSSSLSSFWTLQVVKIQAS